MLFLEKAVNTESVYLKVKSPNAKRSRYVELSDDLIIQRANVILRERLAAKKIKVSSMHDVVGPLEEYFRGNEIEEFVLVYMDTQNRIITIETAFTGTINACAVYKREIVRRVIELQSAAVILSHCHPSGNTEPSGADRRITNELADSLRLIDVQVLDHIIVDPSGVNKAYSFANSGLM